MATLFRLPLLGQTMQEGTILRWLKEEGEPVEGWEPVVEVMTDKINMEVEPQISGTLRKIVAAEGAVIPVGSPVAIFGTPDEDISGLLADLGGPAGAAAGGPELPSSMATPSVPVRRAARRGARAGSGNGGALPAPAEIPAVSPRAREVAGAAGLDWKTLQIAGTGYEGMIVERDVEAYLAQAGRVRLTPLAAKMAAEQGVRPEMVAPSAPGGRARAADVRRAAAEAAPAQEIPLAGIRKVIAERLSASYRTAPHVPLRVDVDMQNAASLRDQLRDEWPRLASVERLTFTDLIAAAAARALAEFPTLNGTLENDVLRLPGAVHLSVAIALDEGLVAPVLRNADRLSLPEVSAGLADLAGRARAGKLVPDDFAGGTFTLTNLGQYGVDSFDPILNPPQIAILGAGRIAERLVAHQGQPAVRLTMTLTLTFDHRATDGVPAGRCLARIKELLENPARLLV